MATPNEKVRKEVESLNWFHPSLTRHVAESLLLQNGKDGTYLLRPRSRDGELAVSIRCKETVKHFPLTWDGTCYVFGMGTFDTIAELVDHFKSKPLIGAESGVLTALKFPYPRDVSEPDTYDVVKIHAQFGMKPKSQAIDDDLNLSNASKEGYLTKQGAVVKNWKTRWFVLKKNELKYYREKVDTEPVKILNLTDCTACEENTSLLKSNCFSLTFPKRTFFMYASTPQEMQDWISLLSWKLKRKNSIEDDP